jgi:phosphoribosylamine--glycine ligase
LGAPYVIKADGLAAGKGVLVTRDRSSAVEFAVSCLEHGRFGAAGARVLIEEFAEGPEVSVMAVCDGERFLLLPPARDHKRALDGDRGPNTGGMGAFAPVSGIDPAFERTLGDTVFAPALAEMASRGTPFRGTLFAGLVLTAKGPRVLEFNARFGDPETEAVMPLLEGRFAELLASAARGNLEAQAITRRGGASVAVALVDERYPDPAAEPGWIEGLESIVDQDVRVFGAALARANPAWRIAGGRAAYVVARGADLAVARARAYAAVRSLRGRGFRFRTDIALPAAGPAGGADSMSHATHGSFR